MPDLIVSRRAFLVGSASTIAVCALCRLSLVDAAELDRVEVEPHPEPRHRDRYVCEAAAPIAGVRPHLVVRRRDGARPLVQPGERVLVLAAVGDPTRPRQVRLYPLTEPPLAGETWATRLRPALLVTATAALPVGAHVVAEEYGVSVYTTAESAARRRDDLLALVGAGEEAARRELRLQRHRVEAFRLGAWQAHAPRRFFA